VGSKRPLAAGTPTCYSRTVLRVHEHRLPEEGEALGDRIVYAQTGPAAILGSGTFAVVYAATLDTKPIAVKVLRQDALPAELESEAQLLHRVQHENVVKFVFAFLERVQSSPRPRLCLALDYEGPSIESVLRSSDAAPPLSTRMRWVQQIALGLRHIHEKGVVHADLCPSNILLRGPEPTPAAAIAGFSRAFLDDTLGLGIVRSRDGVSSLLYEDPSLAGAMQPCMSTDLFSFGVLAYTILSWTDLAGPSTPSPHTAGNAAAPSVGAATVRNWHELFPALGIDKPLAELLLECCNPLISARPDLLSIVERLSAVIA
jgi:serine/threonine protein kinase